MNERTRAPGECVAVCSACGHRVVAEVARVDPFITHDTDCPRATWPVREAILYADEDVIATLDNWVDRS